MTEPKKPRHIVWTIVRIVGFTVIGLCVLVILVTLLAPSIPYY